MLGNHIFKHAVNDYEKKSFVRQTSIKSSVQIHLKTNKTPGQTHRAKATSLKFSKLRKKAVTKNTNTIDIIAYTNSNDYTLITEKMTGHP